MPKGAIARRYAGAMFDIGLKQHSLERTLEDVRGIAQVFAHRKLAYLLREPKVPAKRKETAIRQALANKVLPHRSTSPCSLSNGNWLTSCQISPTNSTSLYSTTRTRQ